MDAMRGSRRAMALRVVVAAAVGVLAGLGVLSSGLLVSLERESRSLRYELRHTPPPRDVVVVAIDDLTFSKLGVRWPFKRSLHARAIDALDRAGARQIVYDVQFTEPTRAREDAALMDSVDRAGGVILATTQMDERGGTHVLGGEENLRAIGARAGAANVLADPGGTITRFPYAVSGLKTLAVIVGERERGRSLREEFTRGEAFIDYQGGPGRFRTLSFVDVVRRRFDKSAVAGKVVVVGAAEPTLQDVHATPTSGDHLMSGPEIQANAITTALSGVPLRRVPAAVDVVLLVLLAIAVPLARLKLSVLRAALLAPALAAAFAVVAQLAFNRGWIVEVTSAMTALVLAAVAMIVVSHLTETRGRQRALRQKEMLEALVRERTEELRETQRDVVWRLSEMAESRDEETGQHIKRISSLSRALALSIGLPLDQADLIGHGAALHDIGKIGVPDRVLLKPGKLDPEEFELMKTHTTIGADVLSGSQSPLLQVAETIARSHHERWDGRGYPEGLKETEIPLAARICSICDVFDALMSKRVYKEAWTLEEALAEIERCAGTQFDPALTAAFLAIAEEAYAEIRPPMPRADARGLVAVGI